MFGDITLKCRPLRLAFLIPPDKGALRTVIQTNSALWGGTFNPIIPVYAHAPKVWKDYPGQKISMKDRIAGYVRAFDPDFIVDWPGSKLSSHVGELDRPSRRPRMRHEERGQVFDDAALCLGPGAAAKRRNTSSSESTRGSFRGS